MKTISDEGLKQITTVEAPAKMHGAKSPIWVDQTVDAHTTRAPQFVHSWPAILAQLACTVGHSGLVVTLDLLCMPG